MDPVAQTYKYLDDREKQRHDAWKERTPRFNPSSIDSCSRLLYYKHTNEPPEFTYGAGFLSQYGPSGDFYHDQVRFEFRDAGVQQRGLIFHEPKGGARWVEETLGVKTEITHNGETFVVSGRGDGEILHDGEWLYSELKSVDAFKYMHMQKAYLAGNLEQYLRDKYSSYFSQSNMMMAPELLGRPGTYLTIINRSNCQFGFADKNFKNREGGMVFAFDPEMWESQKNKMAMITKRAREGNPPLRGERQGSVGCQRCPYEMECWGGDAE